jgi:transcriptional regulator NrdR family protein
MGVAKFIRYFSPNLAPEDAMILCAKCTGKSNVVLTRYLIVHENVHVIRTRKCKACRWKWRTIEVIYTGKDHVLTNNAPRLQRLF